MTSEEGLSSVFAAGKHQRCGGYGAEPSADNSTGSGNHQHWQPGFFLSHVILRFTSVVPVLVTSCHFLWYSFACAETPQKPTASKLRQPCGNSPGSGLWSCVI